MKLTREGWILILFGFLALTVFLRVFTPLTLLTSLVLLVIPAISVIWTIIGSKGIRFSRKVPVEGVAGEEIFITYRLVNTSIFPVFGVRIEDTALRGYIDEDSIPYDFSPKEETGERIYRPRSFSSGIARGFSILLGFEMKEKSGFEEAYHKTDIQADFPVLFPPLWKGQSHEKSVRIKFMVRGGYLIGPAMITAKDPLGIFRINSAIEGFSYTLVLPKWSTLKRFPIGGSSRILRDENIPLEREGWSPEFLGVREYKEGDPLKAVHWKLTARHEQLMVKQFVQQVESSWGILLDLRKGTNVGSGAETSLEYMVSITAAIMERFDNEKVPHVLVMAGDLPVLHEGLRGERIFDNALRTLASCRNDGVQFLNEHVGNLVERFPQLSWVLVTARKDEDIVRTVEVLSRYGGKVIVTQVDMNSFLVSDDLDSRSAKQVKREKMTDMVTKWRRMWGEEMENFDGVIVSLGASYYQVRRGDNLSMIYF